jgi:hypothetical protein
MKGFHFIAALALAAVISGGSYAYTFTQDTATLSATATEGNIATVEEAGTRPDWQSILDDLASENKTRGEVPSGDLFTVTPNPAYTGDLDVKVYLANTDNLSKAYQYLNMKAYMAGSVEADGTPNYELLTLDNGQATFTVQDISPTSGSWTQTSQADFDGGTLYQVDAIPPGDVILDTFTDNVTDPFDDESMIASSVNVTVSGGQVKLSPAGVPGTETLRPDGTGDETLIAEQEPITGDHWDKVDEATSDGDGTYVATNNEGWDEDLYSTADHSTGSGDINYVKVYMVARATGAPAQENARVHIKTNNGEHNGDAVYTTIDYATYSWQWDKNPQTGNAWTWDEIDALQIGAGLRRAKGTGSASSRWTRCTQVYVEVGYTVYTAYEPTGTITSENLLNGETVVSIDSFGYNASAIPSGTSLKVQFSQDNTNWYNSAGTLDGWDTLSQGTQSIDLSGLGWSGPNFYYHMLFTSDETDTPVLDEITVYFSTYYASGTLTSSAYDTGYTVDWGTISFTVDEPSATDIKFQIRTAATEAGLSSATWYGPTGTGDYYQVSGTLINSVHDGDRWIQYKAYFSGPADDTPTLSDVSITYTAQAVVFTVEVTGGGYSLVSANTSEWGTGWTVTPELYCEATQRE